MSTGGLILFALSSVFAIGGAVAILVLRNPLRAAMALLIHIIALAGVYLTLHAHLLAALQLLVYAGAVVVLFVFVIMLIGPDAEESRASPEPGSSSFLIRLTAAVLMGVVTMAMVPALLHTAAPFVGIAPCADGPECGQFGGVEGLGKVIYQEAIVPFELISILLTVAIIGAIAVARGRTPEEVEAARRRKKEIEEAAAREKAEAAHSG